MAFVEENEFAKLAKIRHDIKHVWKWDELNTTTIFKVVEVERTISKYPGKLSGILHVVDAEGTKKKIYASHSLLQEISENPGRTIFIRSLGVSTYDGDKTRNEYDLVAK